MTKVEKTYAVTIGLMSGGDTVTFSDSETTPNAGKLAAECVRREKMIVSQIFDDGNIVDIYIPWHAVAVASILIQTGEPVTVVDTNCEEAEETTPDEGGDDTPDNPETT